MRFFVWKALTANHQTPTIRQGYIFHKNAPKQPSHWKAEQNGATSMAQVGRNGSSTAPPYWCRYADKWAVARILTIWE
jgi:hypothetical protein